MMEKIVDNGQSPNACWTPPTRLPGWNGMSLSQPAAKVVAFLAEAVIVGDRALEAALPAPSEAPQRLHQAMRYSVFAGGKRLRPALVLAASRACAGSDAACMPAMAAVEMLHTYTLIHDDLPMMDDDDLRRGRPTCHRAFDEATAILAGDALQAQAFISCAEIGIAAVNCLGLAASSRGVVGGQQEDLDAEGAPIDGSAESQARLERIHRAKTAALISASCLLGGISAKAPRETLACLQDYGQAAGLAFQIADDLLDATASTETLGKTAGKDATQGKLTYVAVHGLEAARREAQRQLELALASLAPLAAAGETLAGLARYMVERNH
jgi:geranylgeranyl diphosphate synthase type II